MRSKHKGIEFTHGIKIFMPYFQTENIQSFGFMAATIEFTIGGWLELTQGDITETDRFNPYYDY